jgi:hypothetical protein
MHTIITLCLGYIVYLVIFFRVKDRSFLYKEITVILGIKLVIISALYFCFFDQKMTKNQKEENVYKLIVTKN